MTYYDWARSLPAEDLAKLLDCPNRRLRFVTPIPCTQGKPEHDSCDQCIARFLNTDVPAAEDGTGQK